MWDSYDKSLLNEAGEFTVTGKLQDSDAIVSVTVHVIGDIVVMEGYSTENAIILHFAFYILFAILTEHMYQ